MSKCLNTQEFNAVSMAEGDVTILENTVRRLAEEVDIVLNDVSSISYVKELEGKKEDIGFNYHRDFDNYESFIAIRNDALFRIHNVNDKYLIVLKNSGHRLLENANRRKPENPVEESIYLQLITSPALRLEPKKIYEPFLEISESDINSITSKLLFQYL